MTAAMRDPNSRVLSKVRRGALCSGCGGCAVATEGTVEMLDEPPGYLRPRASRQLSAEEEARIAAICPGLVQEVVAGDRIDDTIWGPYLTMETGFATDQELRRKASSGGVLSALLIHLLEQGEVEGVVQVRASSETPIANIMSVSSSLAEVIEAAGSRYAPSAPLSPIPYLLDGPDRFAFVGKPCDVAALRALARLDPRVDRRFPVMISFFCGGVPSLTGGAQIIEAMGATLPQVKRFVHRGEGWPGFATAELEDGTVSTMSYSESWGSILSKHVQHRCKICPDGTGAAADIVCADAWEADDRGYPLFEEQDGISLVVARTRKGRDIADRASAAGAIALKPFDPAALFKIQRAQAWRRRVTLPRLAALALMGKPIPRYRGLHLLAAMRQGSAAEFVRNFLGMIRRVIAGRM